jgi:hypothetical protein
LQIALFVPAHNFTIHQPTNHKEGQVDNQLVVNETGLNEAQSVSYKACLKSFEGLSYSEIEAVCFELMRTAKDKSKFNFS